MPSTHDQQMAELMTMRDNRALKRDISRMTVAALKDELRKRNCSTGGELIILQDRLLRAMMRETDAFVPLVPWYEWDDRDVGDDSRDWTQISAQEDEDLQSEARGGYERVSGASNQTQEQNTVRENVEVPVSSAPLTVSTTSTTTTVASAPIMTSALGAPYRQGENVNARLPRQPNIFDVNLPRQPIAFEVFSAQRVRGVRAVHPDDLRQLPNREFLDQRRAEIPLATPLANRSRAPEQALPYGHEWFGPTNHFASTPRASETFSTESGEYMTPRDAQTLPRAAKSTSATGRRENEGFARHREFELPRTPRDGAAGTKPRPLHSLVSDATEYMRMNAARNENLERREQNRARVPLPAHAEESVSSDEGILSDAAPAGRRRRQQRRAVDGGVLSSSDEGDSLPSRRSNATNARADARAASLVEAVKLLRSWNVRFADEKNEDPEDFIDQLETCFLGADIPEANLIRAMPCVLTKKAARWFRTLPKTVNTWSEFKRSFRNHFIPMYDREDLMDDLRRRTQGKAETISHYLASHRYIVSRFKHPPTDEEQLMCAWRGLLPEYRQAMLDRGVSSLEEMEEFGRRWEKMRALNSKYAPPPTSDKMCVRGAAYEPPTKSRVAAASEEPCAEVAAADTWGSDEKKAKKGGKGKSGKKEEKTHDESGKGAPNNSSASSTSNASANKSSSVDANTRSIESDLLAAFKSWTENNAPAPRMQLSRAPAQMSGPANTPRVMTDRTNSWSRSNQGQRDQFLGVCYECHQVGHRAAECTELSCFRCNQKGHRARDCTRPRTAARESCQVCGTEGVVFKNCPNCESLRRMSGNRQQGKQGK